MKIAFIGGGNMGEAMLAAVLEDGLAKPEAIWVSDVSQARRRALVQKYGVAAMAGNREAISDKEIVVLAVKPQNLVEVMAELSGRLKPGQVALSIVAGARIETLSKGLKHGAIARAMPNTPAQIGEGMSVWTATPEVTEEQKGLVGAILGAMGAEIYVDDEKYLDMATAVSGSGPAYFFLMVESLIEAAVELGLPRDMARKLVVQTMLGSGRLVQQSGEEPAELRRKVTSPGGTTARALEQFEEGQFTGLVKRAVKAAYDRARELG
ncbi:MAG: pyrroline-5-carboxylate reductase [Deltaproteobacteria bacterium]|nr:pyrroline-5-carboxylate reductase [Deltaproteobacteria bacterium]